jgi:hypothetical protein
MIKSTDLAYAAGYIDGDGCFHVGSINTENRIKFRYLFIINSTEIENVQWFQEIFGGTLTTKKKFKENHKPLHRYVLKGKDINIFKDIEPFLIEKLEEFKVFEKFRDPNFKLEREKLIKQMNNLKDNTNLIPYSIKKDLESIRKTIIPTIEDYAYLAGFIDAECCLNIQKSKHKDKPYPSYKMLLQCNNTKSPCFYWISKRFGGQFHFIDRSKYKNNRNQMCWRLSAASLNTILEKIHPFLKHKKPVCEELIKFYKTTIVTGHVSPNSPLFEEYYRPIRQVREDIFHKIQLLNKKGS